MNALCIEEDGTLLYTQNLLGGSVGLFRYDPASGEVSADPLLIIEGDPYYLFPLGE